MDFDAYLYEIRCLSELGFVELSWSIWLEYLYALIRFEKPELELGIMRTMGLENEQKARINVEANYGGGGGNYLQKFRLYETRSV